MVFHLRVYKGLNIKNSLKYNSLIISYFEKLFLMKCFTRNNVNNFHILVGCDDLENDIKN